MERDQSSIQKSDLHCADCGYNLTGSTIGGNCPECGSPIEMSIRRLMLASTLPTSGWAIASFTAGLLGACLPGAGILAIVFYFPAVRQVRARSVHASSHGLAIAGLVLGIIHAVLAASALLVTFWL